MSPSKPKPKPQQQQEQQLPPKYKLIAWQKKDEQLRAIPQEWQITIDSNLTSFLDLPRTCGVLSKEELRITEEYDATGLAEGIRRGELKCVDVTRAFCKRAAIAHQATNCLTEIFFDTALRRAEKLDAHLASGKPPLGPLHGVPVSLKDSFKVNGYDASLGIASLAFKPATTNAVIVDCLLNAGAVLYCKTNVPQTLMALDSHNNVFGRTLNPANTRVTAGGSSGGEGALLAMRGSVLGVGTDVGGSIRIPGMCNGIYGVKPSWERIPYAGQESANVPGAGKLGLPSSAGPMAVSMRDIELFFRTVSEQRPWLLDPDVVPLPWNSTQPSTSPPLRIGLVRTDGVTTPLPPISRLLDEIKAKLQNNTNIQIIELDISPLFSQCQALTNALFAHPGSNHTFDLLESFDEPLSPWLSGRIKRRPAIDLPKLQALHGHREALRAAFLQIWDNVQTGGKLDAFICPVAPHPVPPIDQWNGVSYTSSFVLLDYPAGVLSVRRFTKDDVKGEMASSKPIGGWDKVNRELWTNVDREIYIDTPLCVQVVAPRLQEEKLVSVMTALDSALKGKDQSRVAAKL